MRLADAQTRSRTHAGAAGANGSAQEHAGYPTQAHPTHRRYSTMHRTAFIITSEQFTNSTQPPSEEQLRRAAREAIVIAKKAQTGDENGTDYESFGIGCRQNRFIQGEFRTNSVQFGHPPDHQWPETIHEVMSQIHEPDLSDEGIAAIPLDVLRNCWNLSQNLVTLALENRAAFGTGHPERGLIYPDILLTPEGIAGEAMTFPNQDVFGNTDDELVEGKDLTATQYLDNRHRGSAYFGAQYPVIELTKAAFRCDYIRKMAQYHDHIVLEADWNM